MTAGTAIPELVRAAAERAVARYCADRTPAQHRDEIRMEYTIRGPSITIFECRPPWRPDFGPEWTRMPIAQLRYNPGASLWTLYRADRNSRWHVYELIDPAPGVEPLLAEIDADPTGIFWG
ncbi:MAG: DUF3024 domain-containing protein [Actinomycetota bacterium]|nr:DUF3024 domain-containing protein [Actinomycetota bacterium]